MVKLKRLTVVTLIVTMFDKSSSTKNEILPTDLPFKNHRSIVSTNQPNPWLKSYLRSLSSNDYSNYFNYESNGNHELQPRNHYDDYYYSNYIQEKEDDGLDKTYGFLVPMIIIIGLVSLTIPVVAIMFFMFMYKSNSNGGGGGCNLAGQSQSKQSQSAAEPRLLDSVIHLMGTIDKAYLFMENQFANNTRRHHRGYRF